MLTYISNSVHYKDVLSRVLHVKKYNLIKKFNYGTRILRIM